MEFAEPAADVVGLIVRLGCDRDTHSTLHELRQDSDQRECLPGAGRRLHDRELPTFREVRCKALVQCVVFKVDR